VSPDPDFITVEQATEVHSSPVALVLRRMNDGRLPWLRVCRRQDVLGLKRSEDEQMAVLHAIGEDDEVDWTPGAQWLDVCGGRPDSTDITWPHLRLATSEQEEGRLRQVIATEILEHQPAPYLEGPPDLDKLSLSQLLNHLISLNAVAMLTLCPGSVTLTVRSQR
jgi:hypothetical protein